MTASPPGAPLEHTRPLLLGTGATAEDASALYRRLQDAAVAVSVDPQLPGALITTGVILQTMRRLPSTLTLDPRGLTDATIADLTATVDLVDPNRGMTLTSADPPDSAIRIHVGIYPRGSAIRAVPEGYGGHLLTDPAITVTPTRTANGLGQVFTASLATAEIFKTLAAVRADRRRHYRHLQFCPVTLSRDLQAAPNLTGTGHLSVALLGVGAIGTAIALILSLLPLAGSITLVDRQPFSLENLGTYSLGGWADAAAAIPKTALAARVLDRWEVRRVDADVADLPALIDAGTLPWPEVVLTALDSPEARRDGQLLWPDMLIDTGTSDTLTGMHDLDPAGPCVSCIYPPTTGGPSAAQRLATLTGLDPVYLAADGVLEAHVLDHLLPEQAERLRPLVGTPRCALAQAVGLTDLEAGGYRPSVPFVSQQAACLAVGRLIAHRTGVSTTSNQVQFDALLGPGLLHLEEMAPRPDCYCQLHQTRIQTVRELRGHRLEQ